MRATVEPNQRQGRTSQWNKGIDAITLRRRSALASIVFVHISIESGHLVLLEPPESTTLHWLTIKAESLVLFFFQISVEWQSTVCIHQVYGRRIFSGRLLRFNRNLFWCRLMKASSRDEPQFLVLITSVICSVSSAPVVSLNETHWYTSFEITMAVLWFLLPASLHSLNRAETQLPVARSDFVALRKILCIKLFPVLY